MTEPIPYGRPKECVHCVQARRRRVGRHRRRGKYSYAEGQLVVFYDYGHWWRSAHPSTYDRWLVTAPLTPYQQKLVTPHG